MMDQNDEHLRLLSIFHYIVAGITALFACFPCIHLTVGILIVSGVLDHGKGGQAPPAFVGWLLIAIATLLILMGWSFAIAILLVGKFLARRVHYTYCLVVAAIECIFMPLGTVLGVFTIIVLNRTSVRSLFPARSPIAAQGS
jgi:hypothetical protein